MRSLTVLRSAAALALVALAAVPLRAAVRGPDAGGYTATDATVYSFVDASVSGGAAVLAGTDDAVAPLTLPFPFTFYGHAYSLVCVSSNGAVYFAPTAASCTNVNDIGNVDLALATPNDWPALFPLWTDLTFQKPGGGAVYYQTLGAPGARRFVLQWNNAFPVESATPVTFEVVLSEATNAVLFQYKTVVVSGTTASAGGEATVGIRNAGAGANGADLEWSFDVPVLHDASALLFSTPIAPTLTVTSATVTYDGQPHAVTASATGVSGETLGPITVTYNGSTSAPVSANTYNVVASFAGNGTYAPATATATLTINRATPTITWPAPADITQGTPLGASQLNATASVPGTFVYTPPAGTVLPAGAGQTLRVTFTPTDATDYVTATASVTINVTASTSMPGRFVGDAGVDTRAAQTRFAFGVQTTARGTEGLLTLRTRPNQPAGRDGDNDADDRFGPWSRFVATRITSATASNAPNVDPGRPRAQADTLVFAGVGMWNGRPNYRFTATAVDAGEPGRGRDRFAITITAPNGTVVLTVSGTITSGNIQSLPVQ